jgi:hypothetical protein
MAKIDELRKSDFHQELGQKMCAAFIAQQQGVALNTALKKTALPVGDLWLLLAELARQGFSDYADAEAFSDLAAITSKYVV